MNIRNLLLVFLLFSNAALSDETVWRDEQGQPVEDSESQKSVAGFGGWLIVTPDADWEEKWQTPPDTVPHYNVTSTAAVGETVMTLIFFVNPGIDKEGNAEIRCDLRVVRPSGSVSVDEKDVECYRGPILGDPYALRLTHGLLGFVGEESDERGEWITEVTLTDAVRGVSLDLRTRFDLVDRED